MQTRDAIFDKDQVDQYALSCNLQSRNGNVLLNLTFLKKFKLHFDKLEIHQTAASIMQKFLNEFKIDSEFNGVFVFFNTIFNTLATVGTCDDDFLKIIDPRHSFVLFEENYPTFGRSLGNALSKGQTDVPVWGSGHRC